MRLIARWSQRSQWKTNYQDGAFKSARERQFQLMVLFESLTNLYWRWFWKYIPIPIGEDCCGGSILSLSRQKYLNDLSNIAENKGPMKLDCFLALAEAR